MNNRMMIIVASVVGILLLGVAVLYAIEPAQQLPHFLPGYAAGLMKHHYTHAIGTGILGILAFIFAWFQSGKTSPK